MNAPDPASTTDTLRRQACEAIRHGRYDDAFARLEAALRVDPRDPEVLCDLATLALLQHEYQSAIDFAQHALRFRPDHATSEFVLASAWARSGAPAQALALFERLQTVIATPTPPDQLHELGAHIAAQVAQLRARADQPVSA